ncbi:MAG TPA: four helix bundle protein [Verrucomicrobiae bacterium]|jgi:four helix bundle protein|nr:four helix bundle protein [Verrucomicrobiae bacterium]
MGKHRTSNIEHQTPNEAAAAGTLHDGETGGRKFDLEDRLLEFASAIIDLSEKLPNSRAGNHVAGQVLRSGTSPFPNHGEAESAESRDDFIHKLKICLKELRETRRWARLIQRKGWAKNETTLLFVLGESDELIRIFMSSIRTARQNALAQKRKPETPARYSSGNAG